MKYLDGIYLKAKKTLSEPENKRRLTLGTIILTILGILFFSTFSFFSRLPTRAALDPAEAEYTVSIGPVNGSTSANYVFASVFNPSGSGKTLDVSKIRMSVDAVAAANYTNITLRRTTAASGGTLIPASEVPKKNNASVDTIAVVRHTGVTVTLAGTVNSRLNSINAPGVAGQVIGKDEIVFGTNEHLILQQGEGVALYQEAAGDTDHRIRLGLAWVEVASIPVSQGEYMLSYPRVENVAAADYKYHTFFNPAGSGKTAVIKRLSVDVDADTTAVYTNDIYVRRITAASGGTAITAADVPKKNTSTANSVMDFRYLGVTATLVGTADSKMALVTPPAVAGQPHGHLELLFDNGKENLIIQPGEGIALMSSVIGDIDQLVRLSLVWGEQASVPSSQGEYLFSTGNIAGNITNPYNYTSFFNPVGSGKTAVVKRVAIRVDSVAAAVYIPMTVQRITAASAGTLITQADVSKKHSSTSNTIMEIRHTGVTATKVGGASARIMNITTPGAVAQLIGHEEVNFGSFENLILQPGEGILLHQEGVGDADFRVKFGLEWAEQVSTPSSLGQYQITAGPISGSTTNPYRYISFFNPAASGKTIVVNRVVSRVDAVTTAVYIPLKLRRTSAASGGTLIVATDIPKMHTGSANSIADIRTTNPTVTLSGGTDALFMNVLSPGAVASAVAQQLSGYEDQTFDPYEPLILKPGEGFAFYQENTGDADFRVKLLIDWDEETVAPSSQGEYISSVGPVTGNLNSGYVYASLYNPTSSLKEYVVKRITMEANAAAAAATYIPVTVRRVTNVSGGTLILQSDIPKKHTSTANTTAEMRYGGVTVTLSNGNDSRILGRTTAGAVGQMHGTIEIVFDLGDELILKPGEGIALFQEAAGNTGHRFSFKAVWSEADYPTVVVGSAGTQTANINVPATNQHIGGAFTFIRNTGSTNVTQIIITEQGTVNANTNLSNLKLYYEIASSCTYDANETQFGSGGASFNSSEKATITGTMSVGTSQLCVYTVLDVGSGASNGQTLEIEITNPSTEVTVSSGSVSPATAVAISGTTTLQVSNQTPNSPSDLGQKKTDDTVIPTGGWINQTAVKFTATASDPDNPDTLYLCVEKDILGTSFSSTEDSCGTGVAYSGMPVAMTVTISGITDANQYHWQVRVKDAASAYSGWVSYGGNGEGERDFGIDTTAPTGGSVYDGASGDQDWNDGSLTQLSGNWTGFDANVSSLQKYEYVIRRKPDDNYWSVCSGAGTWQAGANWCDIGSSTSFTQNNLNLQTDVIYYVLVRAIDNAGNTALPVNSNGQQVSPTLSFSYDTNTITFADLNNTNSWTDTKTGTVTTSTNALTGYAVLAYITGLLTSVTYPSQTIANFQGTYSVPETWETGEYGFGYTTNDPDVNSGKFVGNKYAAFSQTASGDVMADHTGPVTGSTGAISNEQFIITYKVAVSQSQAASTYRTYTTYIVTANY